MNACSGEPVAVLASAGVATWEGMALLAATTFIAAAVNSVAGGGTILTFPVVAALVPPGAAQLVTANATSTIGLFPGAVAAAWAYRGERVGMPSWIRWLLPVSVVGGACGAVLVLALPSRLFATLVPWLILAAAVLFAIQPQLAALIQRRSRSPLDSGPVGGATRLVVAGLLQLLVSIYGGYFGAGIGILMLAVLGCLGLGDIHRLNGVKNVLAMVVNGTTAAVFAAASMMPASGGSGTALVATIGPGVVSWPHAGVMAVSAVAGGLAGAGLARRLPAAAVRRLVALIGFGLAGYYFLR